MRTCCMFRQDALYSDYATDDPLMEVLMAHDLTMMAGISAEVRTLLEIEPYFHLFLFQYSNADMNGIDASFSFEVGLDVRLNAEAGPFTVFAPTDAAFNEFLEQFGGGGRKAVIRLKRKGKLQEVGRAW